MHSLDLIAATNHIIDCRVIAASTYATGTTSPLVEQVVHVQSPDVPMPPGIVAVVHPSGVRVICGLIHRVANLPYWVYGNRLGVVVSE